jgi:hypothetical protein
MTDFTHKEAIEQTSIQIRSDITRSQANVLSGLTIEQATGWIENEQRKQYVQNFLYPACLLGTVTSAGVAGLITEAQAGELLDYIGAAIDAAKEKGARA